MPDRLYSETEVQALLRQAADRQQRLGPVSDAHGLTLAEVEAIAAEAGLDPAHVRAAARSGPASEPKRWLGAPREVRQTRHITAPLTDEAWIDIVEDLRRMVEGSGTATQLGSVREWEAGKADKRVHARAEPEGDGFRVELSQDYEPTLKGFIGGGIGMLVTPLMLIMVMITTGNPDPLPGVLIFMLTAAAFFLLPPVLYKQKGERQAERFDAVLDRAESRALDTPTVAPAQLDRPQAALAGWEEAAVHDPIAPVRRRDRA